MTYAVETRPFTADELLEIKRVVQTQRLTADELQLRTFLRQAIRDYVRSPDQLKLIELTRRALQDPPQRQT